MKKSPYWITNTNRGENNSTKLSSIDSNLYRIYKYNDKPAQIVPQDGSKYIINSGELYISKKEKKNKQNTNKKNITMKNCDEKIKNAENSSKEFFDRLSKDMTYKILKEHLKLKSLRA